MMTSPTPYLSSGKYTGLAQFERKVAFINDCAKGATPLVLLQDGFSGAEVFFRVPEGSAMVEFITAFTKDTNEYNVLKPPQAS